MSTEFTDLTALETAAAPKTKKRTARARKKATPVVVPAPTPAPEGPTVRDRSLTHYAVAGVATMSAMSAGLNGYSHAQHATVVWAGWGLGILIPVIILLLGKVAGTLHKRGYRERSYVTAGSGLGLLVLSVWHCAESIALLTGSPLLLALPMAVAIDVGFVCCELAILADETKE
jgi:hypothetical protein